MIEMVINIVGFILIYFMIDLGRKKDSKLVFLGKHWYVPIIVLFAAFCVSYQEKPNKESKPENNSKEAGIIDTIRPDVDSPIIGSKLRVDTLYTRKIYILLNDTIKPDYKQ